MGTKGRGLVGMDVNELINLLNKALADEWLAYYQYWIGAKIVVGPMRGAVTGELLEHADDELRHAGMLVDRILTLGGTPLLTPEEWYKETNCGYATPDDPSVATILDQNIEGEQCAIDVYQSILNTVKDKDPITWELVLEILEDEVEHEDDLQALVEDMQVMKRDM